MKKILYTLLSLCIISISASLSASVSEPIQVGAEQMEQVLSLLRGKRVALVVNQTSVVGTERVHLLDTLLSSGIQVKRVFAPEHGFRGDADAGAAVSDSRDSKTNIPIVSIYGKKKKPSPSSIKDVDIIVFDIQDVGARFYTYISTMHYVMEACAEQNKPMLLLDRPNPNDFIDGPLCKKGFHSFVGMHAIPLLHGLTVGELAQMINGEGWLSGSKKCKLQVLCVKNWKHGDPYELPIKPSPNLPNSTSIHLYPSLCLFEATNISVGRGTLYPFQVLGFPDKRYGSFTFTPQSLPGFDSNPLQKGKKCYGIDLRKNTFAGGFSLQYFLDFYKKAGKKGQKTFISRPQWFDLLAGTDQLRKQIQQGLSEETIRKTWQSDLDSYKEMRKKYLLYPEKETSNLLKPIKNE